MLDDASYFKKCFSGLRCQKCATPFQDEDVTVIQDTEETICFNLQCAHCSAALSLFVSAIIPKPAKQKKAAPKKPTEKIPKFSFEVSSEERKRLQKRGRINNAERIVFSTYLSEASAEVLWNDIRRFLS